jgi:hypothetical protein
MIMLFLYCITRFFLFCIIRPGDILSIDTASITGEPLPRHYPSEEYGNLILCGTTVKAGEVRSFP